MPISSQSNMKLEIIAVTSSELLEEVHGLIDTVTKFNWAPYAFKTYDFASFEETAEYDKLAKIDSWAGEYDRAKRGIFKNHWSFWSEKYQIRFVLIDPLASPEWRQNSFAHEIAHLSLCENVTTKLIDSQLNHNRTRELVKRLNPKADRGQLLMSAAHIIQFPKDIMADRWVAERSRKLLEDSLEEARSVWTETVRRTGELGYSVGFVLMSLRQYLTMELKLDLAHQNEMQIMTSTLSGIKAEFEKIDLFRLVPEKSDLWSLASKLRIVEYTDLCMKVIRRLAKTVPLKSTKVVTMPPST